MMYQYDYEKKEEKKFSYKSNPQPILNGNKL